MADLKTTYLGIDLKNPVIVGASNMVNNVDNIKQAEEAGAAAVVYKSLFEEQIQLEQTQLSDDMSKYDERHPEMINLFPKIEHSGPKEHLVNLRKAKESVSIPIIASMNAIYKESWIDYAKQIEETGVAALELNFYAVPREFDKDGAEVEKEQVEILKEVKKEVNIPVSVKLSPFYANPLNVISKLDKAACDGYVLFNRLFQPDIDVNKEEHTTSFFLTPENEGRLSLRYSGLLYGNVNGSICSNTGIYSGNDVARMILAGADCVQVVSVLYKKKIEEITSILGSLEKWMDEKGYKSLDDFKGKLSNNKINDPFVYKRAQYVDLLLNSEDIIHKYVPR
jgi:dihydroorotate dehydrogenase (fumarate)